MLFYKAKVRFIHWFRYELPHKAKPPRVTPLTFCLWLALASDLAAPGYLVFHLGVTRLDVKAIAAEVSTITNAGGE